MSLLISIKWMPGRSAVIKGCKSRLGANAYDACSAWYWSFGRQYQITVLRDGSVQDSRMPMKRRIQRWLDSKQRNQIQEALNARLAARDRKAT